MTLPKAVQAAAERATAAHKAAYEKSGDAALDNGKAGDEAAPSATNTPDAESKAAQATPGDKPATSEPPADQKLAEQTKDAMYWQHRFEVLKGKYNTEVEAWQKDLKEANAKIQALEDKVKSLQESESNGSVMDQLNDLSPEEIEEFGPDLVKFVQRVVRNSVQKADAPDVVARIDKLEQEREAEEAERREQATSTFWAELETAHPDFREVNADVNFHAFLQGPSPYSEGRRQDDLTAAQSALDYRRVIAIFDAFKETQPARQQQRDIPKEQISPPPARGAGVDDAQEGDKPTFTRAFISRFYVDAAQGKYTPDEKARLEAQIFEAQRAGRIV